MTTLVQQRFNYGPHLPPSVAGTFGTLVLPSGTTLYTVEPPWLSNKPSKSCIPDGVYKLRLRESPIIERITKGKYTQGWEITGVPGREYIMIHPGNWASDFEGCMGVGMEYGMLGGRLAVTSSNDAFDLLMDELDVNGDHEISILPFIMAYP